MARPFLTREWATEVRRAINATPSAQLRAAKSDAYWAWVDRVRARYRSSWALGVEPAGHAYLLLRWGDGGCFSASIVDAEEAERADYVLVAGYQDWRALFNGFDPGRAVMSRAIRLRKGSVLAFFRGLYLFTESIASMCRVPTSFADNPAR